MVMSAQPSKKIKPSIAPNAAKSHQGFMDFRTVVNSSSEKPDCEVIAQMVSPAIATKTTDHASLLFKLLDSFFFDDFAADSSTFG